MNDSSASNNVVHAYSEKTNEYSSLLLYTLVALLLALVVRLFIATPYMVSGESMDPTFKSWDYLVIDRVTYQFEPPARGDVIVFKYPYDPERSFIKRIIGLPGETIMLQGNSVRIINTEHPEGFVLAEPYITDENKRPSDVSVTLEEGMYFVMGDNRRASADSRSWGALPEDHIVGRAIVRLFPFTHIDILPGIAHYENE